MKEIPINTGWLFSNGITNNVEHADVISIPHDYIIEKNRAPAYGSATGFFPGGSGTYFKDLSFLRRQNHPSVLLNIDGAYMNAEVFLDSDLLAIHPYGYTAFQVDLSECLYDGRPNLLRIYTNNVQNNSRWYSGGGLYREVSLFVGGNQFIHPWDLFVSTPHIAEAYAEILLQLHITNRDAGNYPAQVWVEVTAPNGGTIAQHEETVRLSPQGKTPLEIRLLIPKPQLWDLDTPALYSVQCAVIVEGKTVDESQTHFGIRSIEIDAMNGFRLNGVPMKLRGGCIHHDHAMLGACAYPAAERRKVRLLKECGYTALRMAHNPPSKALLDACDELGMLVLNESFDMWRMPKNPMDYHLWFEDWWQRDMSSMICRDRNHPCIYACSIGNEIEELLGTSDGANWTRRLADYTRSLDPTRPVSASANGYPAPVPGREKDNWTDPTDEDGFPLLCTPHGDDLWGEQTRAAGEALDLFGYNYQNGRYTYDRTKFPSRVIHATETHPYYTYAYWKAVLQNPNCIGDFIWTAFDNLGEAGAGRIEYDRPNFSGGLTGG